MLLGDTASSCWQTAIASTNLLARYSSSASGLSCAKSGSAATRASRTAAAPRALISGRLRSPGPAAAAADRSAGDGWSGRHAGLASADRAGPGDADPAGPADADPAGPADADPAGPGGADPAG